MRVRGAPSVATCPCVLYDVEDDRTGAGARIFRRIAGTHPDPAGNGRRAGAQKATTECGRTSAVRKRIALMGIPSPPDEWGMDHAGSREVLHQITTAFRFEAIVAAIGFHARQPNKSVPFGSQTRI